MLLMAIVAFPLFAHIDELPVQMWDEARQAHYAYEMLQTGDWLVTTYNYEPDMWNVKPPLLVWLMAGSMKIFGVNELAIRMPSAIASLFTFILLFWFVGKTTGNRRLAFLAGFVLVTTEGYIKLHGTRTGDYDALLTMFTTGYIFCYFLYLQTNIRKYLLFFFILLTGAALTKGIAGMLMLPGIFLYTVFTNKTLTTLKSGNFYIGLLIFLVFAVGFYFLRDHYNPGFINVVLENEVGGRFNTVIEGHSGGPFFYVELIKESHFIYWFMLIPVGIAISVSKDVAERKMVNYLLLLSTIFLLILSTASTKIPWYDMPVFPLLSIIVAVGLDTIIGHIQSSGTNIWYKAIVCIPVAVLLFAIPYYTVLGKVLTPKAESQFDLNNNMGLFMKQSVEGRWNLNGYTFVNDSKEDQNISFYILSSKYNVAKKNVEELVPGDTVAVFKQGVKDKINETYKTNIIQSFGEVKVYVLTDTIGGK